MGKFDYVRENIVQVGEWKVFNFSDPTDPNFSSSGLTVYAEWKGWDVEFICLKPPYVCIDMNIDADYVYHVPLAVIDEMRKRVAK